MTNLERSHEILRDFLTIEKEYKETNEVAQRMIDSEEYFIAVLAAVTYLFQYHETFLMDLIIACNPIICGTLIEDLTVN